MEKAAPDVNRLLPVSVRRRPELNAQLGVIATALDRPKSWVIEQAVTDYLAVQNWHLAAIDQGLRAADAGRSVPHDDVRAWVQSWESPDELPMPECG